MVLSDDGQLLLVDVEGTGSVDEVRQRMFDMVDAHAGANR